MIEYINLAKEMSNKNNYCKHSNFSVGAVLITKGNKVYTGCNIENDGIQSICAEKCSFVKALSEGETEFKEVYVMGKSLDEETFKKITPCGYCRQFMSEYVKEDFKIFTYDEEENKVYEYGIKDLLPESFHL